MNPPKSTEEDYIRFLMVTQNSYSACEAERVQPEEENAPSHDAFTRLLKRLEPDAERLWDECRSHVKLDEGVLIIDDSTLDKPYSTKLELVSHHWSGKHHEVVKGINLVTLLWSGNQEEHIPCDYRIYSKENGMTKNDHFSCMIQIAAERGFKPEYVLFDSWYSSLDNLKLLRRLGFHGLTRLKSDRLVDPNKTGNIPIKEANITETGTVVHLKGYGFIRCFRIVSKEGNVEHWATDKLNMDELTRLKLSEKSWAIENYHRGVKQFTGIEKCQSRSVIAQKNHIGLCIRAFLRFEFRRITEWVSWFDSKIGILREAMKTILANPPPFYLPTA